jgi:cytolysin (calcineurin-like family phosphatase)
VSDERATVPPTKERVIAPVDLALLATSDIIASLMNANHEETANLTRGLDAVNALRDYLIAVRNLEALERPE